MVSKGFTLIELMVVVAIIGVLAALAVPSVSAYIRDAKKTEGVEHLKSLSDGAVSYYNTEHFDHNDALERFKFRYPHSGSVSIPVTPAGIGTKNNVADAAWQESPWRELGFELGRSFYYQFTYESSNNDERFQADARASLQEENDSHYRINGYEDGRISSVLELP